MIQNFGGFLLEGKLF